MQETTQASHPWLASHFGSPGPVYLAKLITTSRHDPTLQPFLQKLR